MLEIDIPQHQAMDNNREYTSETRRWLLLGLICVAFTGFSYLATGFVIARRVVAEYYGRDRDEVAMLGSMEYLFAFIALVITAMIGRNVNFRRLSIAAMGLLFIGAASAAVGFMERNSYWMIVVSFVTTGLSSGLLFILPTFLSDLWMSADLNPLVFGIAFAFSYIGGAASVLTFKRTENATMSEYASGNWIYADYNVRKTYVGGFGVISLLVFASVVLTCVCMDNKVRLPSDDLEIISSNESRMQAPDCCGLICLERIVKPFLRVNLVLPMYANFLLTPLLAYAFLLLPGVFQMVFPSTQTNIMGYIFAAGLFSGAFGTCLAIFVLMRYKRRKLTSAIGSAFAAITAVGLLLSYKFESFGAVVFCQTVMIFLGGLVLMSLLELLLYCNKTSDKISVLSLHFAFLNLGMFIFDLLGNYFNATANHIAYCMIMVITSALIPCIMLFVDERDPNEEADDVALDALPTEESRLIE